MKLFSASLVSPLLFVFSTALAGQSLSDKDAKSVIEAHWNKTGRESPMQGNYTVVNRGWNWAKGTVSQHTYKDMLVWSKLGFLTISTDKKYENFKKGKGFSLSQANEFFDGVQNKITVRPTETGLKFKHPKNSNWLKVPFGQFIIKSIVKNEERLKGVDEYRVVMVTYIAKWSQEFAQFGKARDEPMYEMRKATVLLKWDPFNSKWNVVTYDIAEENKDFTTKYVVKELQR
ncbi:MAG: hypothetical protein AB2809_21720 [Candidatus Thiodiazotropha sp.]